MKIGIISDTHDNSPAVVWIIEYLNKHGISISLHAGDIINPGILKRFAQHYTGHLHFVFGNNDGELSMITQLAVEADNLTCHNREMDVTIEGKRIFMNHYSTFAEAQANTGDFDICIGGHDHQYRVKKYDSSIFINPGNTVTRDKWIKKADFQTDLSFVVLNLETLETEKVIVEI